MSYRESDFLGHVCKAECKPRVRRTGVDTACVAVMLWWDSPVKLVLSTLWKVRSLAWMSSVSYKSTLLMDHSSQCSRTATVLTWCETLFFPSEVMWLRLHSNWLLFILLNLQMVYVLKCVSEPSISYEIKILWASQYGHFLRCQMSKYAIFENQTWWQPPFCEKYKSASQNQLKDILTTYHGDLICDLRTLLLSVISHIS